MALINQIGHWHQMRISGRILDDLLHKVLLKLLANGLLRCPRLVHI
jgi:hypothetical protein